MEYINARYATVSVLLWPHNLIKHTGLQVYPFTVPRGTVGSGIVEHDGQVKYILGKFHAKTEAFMLPEMDKTVRVGGV